MTKVSISLVDSDYVVHARAEMSSQKKNNSILELIQHLDEDFIQGESAFIEIDGLKKGRLRLMVSQVEA